MGLPNSNVLAHLPPVLRRWTLWCVAIAMAFSVLAVVWVMARRPLGIPTGGWFRFVPLALGLTPVVIVFPLWYGRTRWIRRALRESGWRLCTHCAYDVSALARAGTCPECGGAYDVEKDAPLWEDLGVERPERAARDSGPVV